jgi:hypothetical protein
MQFEFQSSITRGGEVLRPDHIIINQENITWRKRNKYLIGYDSISIPIGKISSIELDDKIWGVDITIKGIGSSSITAKCFTAADANKIKELLTK